MVEHIMRVVNGHDLLTGKLLNGIGEIKDDGTTNSGMWIDVGVTREGGVHMAKRRGQEDPDGMRIYPGYGWVWFDKIPEFYEPVESPTKNALHMNPNAQFSPCVIYPRMPDLQKIGKKDEFPYVLCSSSICEHRCSGTITRHITWLNELVKELIEMPVQRPAH